MRIRSEESRLAFGIEQAVKSYIKPMSSTRPCTFDMCGSEIEIGANVVELPGKRKTFTICGDCFELFRICPGPRPME
jgi:hypothetical protein